MTTRVAESLLSRLSACIAEQLGLYFPRARWSDLARGIAMASRDLGWEDIDACIQWLTSSPLTQSQIEILARHLTVGETYFFREPRSFDVLAAHILPAFVRARRGKAQYLRFWSAGCCTGEEPYSIAILLGQELPDVQNWEVTIVATEINTHFLQKAAKGLYNAWSFRATPPEIKERYFTKAEAGQWAILPRIKNLVQFS
jgi:chemotaxis protein methyltransferase CheR